MSRGGEAMLRKDADRFLKQMATMANANVPEEEHVNCTPTSCGTQP